MILIIDNYDSFVYNLARYVSELGELCRVVRNDAMTISDIAAFRPTQIILSPGPGEPKDAGCCESIVQFCAERRLPLLGVCLGHQAIAEAFGAVITRANRPMHGKSADIKHDGEGIFNGLPNPLKVGRYHSLIVNEKTLPPCLRVTARSEDGEVMGLQHADLPLIGVQFHPESVLTVHGHAIMQRFLEIEQHQKALV